MIDCCLDSAIFLMTGESMVKGTSTIKQQIRDSLRTIMYSELKITWRLLFTISYENSCDSQFSLVIILYLISISCFYSSFSFLAIYRILRFYILSTVYKYIFLAVIDFISKSAFDQFILCQFIDHQQVEYRLKSQQINIKITESRSLMRFPYKTRISFDNDAVCLQRRIIRQESENEKEKQIDVHTCVLLSREVDVLTYSILEQRPLFAQKIFHKKMENAALCWLL